MVAQCPFDDEGLGLDQPESWGDDVGGSPHFVGLVIAATCAFACDLITTINIIGHARNYNNP
jgi:hypothetical protein